METYLVKLESPGLMLELPHNGIMIRTPCHFIVEKKDLFLIESMIRLRSISKYKIILVEGGGMPEISPPSVPKLQIKKPTTSIDFKLKPGEGQK